MSGRRGRRLLTEATGGFRLTVGATLLVLAVAVAAAGWLTRLSQPRIDALDHAIGAVEDAHAGLLDEQGALRGYVVTGDAGLLASYRAARPRVAAADRALAGLPLNGTVRAEVTDFRLAQQAWRVEWAAVALSPSTRAALRTEAPGAAARIGALFDSGQARFDAYRVAEARLLRGLRAEAAAARAGQRLVLVGAGLLLAVLGLSACGLLLHRRRRLVRRVVLPVLALQAALAADGAGEPPTVDAPVELVRLGDGLAASRRRLRELRAEAAAHRQAADVAAARLRQLRSFGREVAGGRSPRYVLAAACDAACAVGGWSRARVWLLDRDGGSLRLGHDTAVGRTGAVPVVTHPLGAGPVGRTALHGEVRAAGPLDGEPVLALPLTAGGTVVGVLEALVDAVGPVDEDVLAVLEALCGHAAAALQLAGTAPAEPRAVRDPDPDARPVGDRAGLQTAS